MSGTEPLRADTLRRDHQLRPLKLNPPWSLFFDTRRRPQLDKLFICRLESLTVDTCRMRAAACKIQNINGLTKELLSLFELTFVPLCPPPHGTLPPRDAHLGNLGSRIDDLDMRQPERVRTRSSEVRSSVQCAWCTTQH